LFVPPWQVIDGLLPIIDPDFEKLNSRIDGLPPFFAFFFTGQVLKAVI